MTDRFLTIVYRDPTPEEVEELVYHPRVSAMCWGHAMDDRDSLQWRMQRLIDQAPTPVD